MKIQVLLFGNFGYNGNKLNGQTMELRQMRELLEKHQVERFVFYDVSLMRGKLLDQFKLLRDLARTEQVFYFAAQSNLKIVFPFLYFLSIFMRFKLQYFAVGGWLPEYLKKYPIHVRLLKKIPTVYVELESMVEKLTSWYGFNNAKWFPNFRIFDFQIPTSTPDESQKLKLVFMARVNQHKGYPAVFKTLEGMKELGLEDKISVDFYGPMFEPERDDFEQHLSAHPNANYHGVLQPADINATLAQYDAMIFPTEYPGEGLPGTIIDSYISGIPVIATNWRYNSELVKDGISGLVFEPGDQEQLNSHVLNLINNKEKLKTLKVGATAERDRFGEETVWRILENDINLETK